jgi:WD40 repeat protein
MTFKHWDIERNQGTHSWNNHQGDIMAVSVSNQRGIFVWGACDSTSKVFDLRVKMSVKTFWGHTSDINVVHYRSGSEVICTGSDEAACRLFRMRAHRELHTLSSDRINSGITLVVFSASGRLIFAGYDDFHCHVWDSACGDLNIYCLFKLLFSILSISVTSTLRKPVNAKFNNILQPMAPATNNKRTAFLNFTLHFSTKNCNLIIVP